MELAFQAATVASPAPASTLIASGSYAEKSTSHIKSAGKEAGGRSPRTMLMVNARAAVTPGNLSTSVARSSSLRSCSPAAAPAAGLLNARWISRDIAVTTPSPIRDGV